MRTDAQEGMTVLTVVYRAVLASFFLKEELGHIGRIGCTLCVIGSVIIVLHAPADKDIQTVDEILHYAIQPGACITPSSTMHFLKASLQVS